MKLVITGGPCAGKTTICEILVKTFADRLILIPEAATLMFNGGFPRTTEAPAKYCQQRAIYHVQRELEEIHRLNSPTSDLICDRGGLDALAYWPSDASTFFDSLGTSMEKEIARYDWVLHLDTTGTKEYRRTPVRTEDFNQASEMNERVKKAWALHPRRVIVPHNDDFSRKIIFTLDLVSQIFDGRWPHPNQS